MPLNMFTKIVGIPWQDLFICSIFPNFLECSRDLRMVVLTLARLPVMVNKNHNSISKMKSKIVLCSVVTSMLNFGCISRPLQEIFNFGVMKES